MAAPGPAKGWKAEYAKSGRSSCKSCKSAIAKDQFRLGKMVVATQFDGFMPMWNHASCIFKKANQIKDINDVEGVDLLRWDDQEEIRKYVEAGSATSAADSNEKCAIEVSQTSRASCKQCNQKIQKGTVRVMAKSEGHGARGQSWHHINCFLEMHPGFNLKNLSGWDTLPHQDQETLLVTTVNQSDHPVSKGTKRKKGDGDDKKGKVSKLDGKDAGDRSGGNAVLSSNADSSSSELERNLKEQSDALWRIKDELKKHLTNAELREMLESNGQDSSGSEYDLRDRCADGMLFGALSPCPVCSGSLHYVCGQYRCLGYVSEWSKCSYSTGDPERVKSKWKIPDGTSNEYLKNWYKTQKVKKPSRILPVLSPAKCVGQSTQNSQLATNDDLGNLKVVIVAASQKTIDEWKVKLMEAGANLLGKITKDITALIRCGEVDDNNPDIRKARKLKVPVVREDYLVECIKKKRLLPYDLFKVESALESSRSGIVTVKVKGSSAVHESSGLQDMCHILEDGKSIYNTTLNLSDLSTGVNSYYILQIIQEDKGSDCYVFRKWGRVGNEKIGGKKLEGMAKDDAIHEFKRLFLEKTGNPWEAWEEKKFEKQPGRFYPIDIDYGIKKTPKTRDLTNVKSLLAPQLSELMKMLFDVETYRAAMREFDINMSQMPLGKLSKENIQKGFEALTEMQSLLSDHCSYDLTMRESLIVAASNRFFTLIPSVHPHVIRDEDDFKAKVKMLEALQDMEIASRIVGFDGDHDESLDEKYRKLRCDISPLSHDCEDYKMVQNYLMSTHAPTHKDWTLELEEVFSLEREGEVHKYAPYREKLHNKMLLWHGSRLTNFVGILSQGLRIAPPEAPATGYMFGKGLYFADLVSKSAQYCYVDKKDPVGLMLLSEVALGEIHELKKATYMDKPPKGKHSTKGLGKTVPLESEFVKWRDEVVVPCGKPVPASIRASELLYNEYIVYNTAQVKLQFLLKVRFHHKR